MKQLILINILVSFFAKSIQAQVPVIIPMAPVYEDPAGAALKATLSTNAIRYSKNGVKNVVAISPLLAINLKEKNVRNKLSNKALVNFWNGFFLKYQSSCNVFKGDKEKACKKKINYMRKSHLLIWGFLSLQKTVQKIPKGKIDLINEAYTSIYINMIAELEKIRIEAEEETRFKKKNTGYKRSGSLIKL